MTTKKKAAKRPAAKRPARPARKIITHNGKKLAVHIEEVYKAAASGKHVEEVKAAAAKAAKKN